MADQFDDILSALGFREIANLRYRMNLKVWWNEQDRIQILILPLGSRCLLKGSKDYYLRSITEEGETWARQIGPLQDFLESSLPEIRISFSHFRDITSKQAMLQVKRRHGQEDKYVDVDAEEIAALQKQLIDSKSQLSSNEQMINFSDDSPELVNSYLRRQNQAIKADIKRRIQLPSATESNPVFLSG